MSDDFFSTNQVDDKSDENVLDDAILLDDDEIVAEDAEEAIPGDFGEVEDDEADPDSLIEDSYGEEEESNF